MDIKFCVSLTTIPSRVKGIYKTIQSIQNQTLKPNKIYLNIPYKFKRFKNLEIDVNDIQNIKFENLEIIRCEDYGPATKLMGTIKKTRNYDCVILLDDDHLYDKNICEIFIQQFMIKPINYSFYLNKIFNIKMGQCADGFLINTKYLDKIEEFYFTHVLKNKNLFHDDDLWFALYLHFIKNTTIENLLHLFQMKTNQKVVYKQHSSKDIDALHQTIHKTKVFLNRRKKQKIEYIKILTVLYFKKLFNNYVK